MHLPIKIHPLTDADASAICAILGSDEIGKTYMLPIFEDKQQIIDLFIRLLRLSQAPNRYVRGIYAQDQLIGFLNDTEITGKTIELGYVIGPNYQGRGYMTRALRMAIAELFTLGYDTVTAGAFSENTASIRVMEKCGMHRLDREERITYRGNSHCCVFYEIKPSGGSTC